MKRLWLLITGHERWWNTGVLMAAVLLLLLLLDARPAEAQEEEAAVAPDDDATRLRGLKELQAKGETGKTSLVSPFCVKCVQDSSQI